MATFEPGDQIAYIPDHANGDIKHQDVEFGFVTSIKGDVVYCRYWRKDLSELRTKANSEATPSQLLVHYRSVPDEQVNKAISENVLNTDDILVPLCGYCNTRHFGYQDHYLG